ncbi:transposase [Nitrosomonas sp. Is37]|uniref:transposase n=1 Tax=Nitrosomonas sp. Is37 TaxID=3080535 RepID=UPI00294ABEF9|nr:transposase [Nitrosomonas sp. Is37]MDV6345792.1 transposase [Nitrosomonas sp. Is37]
MKTLSTQSTQQSQSSQACCANAHGFSLHAGVRCAMNQRGKLEHLCRYITRPAIAEERLARNKDGQVVLMLKTPYRDGTTHIVMSPLEFMQWLAALVPRPRLNLIRFHGVLAPNAKFHSEIIPGNKKNKSHVSDRNGDAPPSPASVRISWVRLLKRVLDIDIEHCSHCGGTLKIIAAILESSTITKILDHLGLSSRAPHRAPVQVFDPFG